MPKAKVHFTGTENATLALHAKHKKDGSVKVYIYPILYKIKSRKPINHKDYDKKDALAVLDFENQYAVETLIGFLNIVRDFMIKREAYTLGYLGFAEDREKVFAEIDALAKSMKF